MIKEEDILLKIKKLMELGNSVNENEAKQATNKAYKLLAKYNLSLEELKNVTREYSTVYLGCKHFRTPTEYRYILDILHNNFFVVPVLYSTSIQNKKSKLKTYKLFGTPSNIKVAIYVFVYLVRTYKSLYSNLKKDTSLGLYTESTSLYKSRSIDKNSYYMGLTKTINTNLKKSKEEIESEGGLIIVEDKELRVFKDSLRSGGKTRINIKSDSYNQGLIDGAKVQIKKAVSNEIKKINNNTVLY